MQVTEDIGLAHGDDAMPRISLDELAARGLATRFKAGNQVAKGNTNGRAGRPRKSYSRKLDRASERSVAEALKVVFDKSHPWHDQHGPRTLLALMRVTTVKRREITGADGGELNLVDVQALIFNTPGRRSDDDD